MGRTSPTSEKRKGRTRLALLTGAISLILVCLFAVGSSFAWFSVSVTNANTLTIGVFTVNHTVTNVNGTELLTAGQLLPDGAYPAGMYTLTLRAVGNSSGYGRIRIRALDGSMEARTLFTPSLSRARVSATR